MTLIYIAVAFIIGPMFGKYSLRSFASKSGGKSPETTAEMREEAHEAIQARTK